MKIKGYNETVKLPRNGLYEKEKIRMKNFWKLPRICSVPDWNHVLVMVSAVFLIIAGVLGLGG